ncbi:MAG: 6-bladed beta-propeller [Gemmatimonadetes bacterium]|nr:6-bladed beta-propeller [Gemmatimonadota bacterium]MYB98873.1 6-bladed beta-propeller [Gemmatimonadota bacterium]MYI46423.1 6-bladed beta-propeller [Gemmatimonadota bacterium]
MRRRSSSSISSRNAPIRCRIPMASIPSGSRTCSARSSEGGPLPATQPTAPRRVSRRYCRILFTRHTVPSTMSAIVPPFRHATRHLIPTAALPLLLAACGSGADTAAIWSGTVDTVPSGEIVVHNTDDPLWMPEQTWRVVEDLRIGNAMSEGPDLFGSILSFDVDAWGRIFVLDNQAQEVRIFDSDGSFVRAVGRKGEGPGEFIQAGSVDLSRNGEIWVMGMSQGRVAIFDTAGTFLRQEPTHAGGMVIKPYPGGFDPTGRYNVELRAGRDRRIARFDQSFGPIDTIAPPEDQEEPEYFELVSEDGGGVMRAGVPFQGFMAWRFSRTGTFWTLLTGRYELTEVTTDGNVLRRVTKDHEPIPVADEEREEAIERLDWFTSQGGTIDRSKFPGSKPSTTSFFVDDEGSLWVERTVAFAEMAGERGGRRFDVFDAEGRFLGTVTLPFALPWSIPEPIVRDGVLYGVTNDEVGVEYVVRGRIVKPTP